MILLRRFPYYPFSRVYPHARTFRRFLNADEHPVGTNAQQLAHIQSRPARERYSVHDLRRDRLWTVVAGVDPNHDNTSAEIWGKWLDISNHAYRCAMFDVAAPWMAQEPSRKNEARDFVKEQVQEDAILKQYPGLRDHDLIAWRFSIYHSNRRQQLRSIVKRAEDAVNAPFIPKIIEAVKKGQMHMLQKPQPRKMEELAQQGVRKALTRETKRHYSNELHWKRRRDHMLQEPSEEEKHRQEVAQAQSRRSAGALQRWQKWREALRAGEIPAHTRVWSEESRKRQSELFKQRQNAIEYTPERREMKRKVGATGLKRRWAKTMPQAED